MTAANPPGIAGALEDARRAFGADIVAAEQMDLLEPVSPEEMLEAREELGPDAGPLTVLRHAREQRTKGRPPGARNRRTDDLARYLLQFGEDPLVGAVKLATTQPELLMAASLRKVTKVLKGGKDKPDELVTFEEETLTYEGAQSLIARARELVAPYIWGKKPVAIVHDFSGLKDLVIEGVTHSRDEVRDIVDADFIRLDGQSGEGGE